MRSFRAEDLFGDRTITFDSQDYLFHKPMPTILYGENGCGKTTVLNILFHTLSCASRVGHKTALADIAFRSIRIELSNGVILELFRQRKSRKGSFTMSVVDLDGIASTEDFRADREFRVHADDQPSSQDSFLQHVASLTPDVYYMTDSRRFESDKHLHLQERRRRLQERPYWHHDEPSPSERAAHRYRESDDLLAIQLYFLLKEVSQIINKRVLAISGQGDNDSFNIYRRVVDSIAHESALKPQESDESAGTESIEYHLQELDKVSRDYARYGFVKTIDASPIISAIQASQSTQRNMINRVLSPYVRSLNSRYTSLQSIFGLINSLVPTVNQFLTRKSLLYTLQDGFSVTSTSGEELELTGLSSGEKHLLMIFASSILANDQSSLFLVDEPEMSLNTIWQQKLVDALYKCSPDANTQFILATHSHEIVSQYIDSVVQL